MKSRDSIPDPFKDDADEGEFTYQDPLELRARRNCFFNFFYKIVMSGTFQVFITLCIFANTILLALDRHPISDEEFNDLEIANRVLTWIFFTEMVFKLIGMGIKGYIRDKFNLFDCIIVIISVVEELMSFLNIDGLGSGGAISAFRGVRLLRVFKLARSWKSF